MQTPELSVILPVKDVEIELPGILRSLKEQIAGTAVEWIVVDMGSEDQTVLRAVQYIKEEKMHGFVIQNGKGSVSAALNTGMQKATGEYLTFAFARRLYRAYLESYLETARQTQADLVFGAIEGDAEPIKGKAALDGAWYARQMAEGKMRVDIAALLLRRNFIQAQKLHFQENCRYGYSEEFIYCCLLCGGKIAKAPLVLKRNRELELWRGKGAAIGREVFQSIEAALRVQAVIENRCEENRALCESFAQEKIPGTIMDCVDVLLREGVGYNALRGYLRVEGYDRLLIPGRRTSRVLRRRLQCWNLIPWMYRPKT
ncbi:glycosyltransferase family 2 protein [Clostridium minihomine]|uniref:glycosyltransferase family 2 protein n=1 Tax=Clostridium minihomine TaxID=2045012 RepID=UPI000C75A764|nr:glycosyltransferase [Clostridium minihomine]